MTASPKPKIEANSDAPAWSKQILKSTWGNACKTWVPKGVKAKAAAPAVEAAATAVSAVAPAAAVSAVAPAVAVAAVAARSTAASTRGAAAPRQVDAARA